MTDRSITATGRLVLEDRVADGRLTIADGLITRVEASDTPAATDDRAPYLAPGFVDVHVHGGGGHDAMGDRAALDGMARHLLRHGVTSFLPTAVTAPLPELVAFAARVRSWLADAPADGAQPLGFNLEGPFLAMARRGAHDPASLLVPADVARDDLEPLLDGLRVLTIAPELPGAIDLIGWLRGHGVRPSLGHSAATLDEARRGYAAGGASTTHLFNAMSGVDHRAPGLAVAALLDDAVYVELIADGIHVDPGLWPLIRRLKPADRLVLVSDAISLAGMGDGRGTVGGLAVEVERSARDAGRDGDPRRLGHRARRRGPQPRHLGVSAPGRRRSREPQPAGAARGRRPRSHRGRPAGRPRRAGRGPRRCGA